MAKTALAVPQDVDATGIRKSLLEDLTLKILYLHGEVSVVELAKLTCLSIGVIEEIFQFFRKEQLCEVKGMVGGAHRIVASALGKQRAAELFAINQYAGPAPVSLADYISRVQSQSVTHTRIQPADLSRALSELVLTPVTIGQLGTAVISGASIFLYGPSGTGKTSIASCIPEIYNDSVWVPHAVEVDSQIITIYDPGVHLASAQTAPDDFDRRWMWCRRPCVVAGGELSAEMLDLQYSPTTRFFTAPLQLKANNGVLILDDFGRQRMPTNELLNRWMTPLDRRIDFLTLPGGRKFQVPFDLFVVFSTNLNPRELTDEAFLRRIPNKIEVEYASAEQFAEIFESECRKRGLTYEEGIPEYVARYISLELKQPLRQCVSRDLLNQIFWTASYQGERPELSIDSVARACQQYFLPAKIN